MASSSAAAANTSIITTRGRGARAASPMRGSVGARAASPMRGSVGARATSPMRGSVDSRSVSPMWNSNEQNLLMHHALQMKNMMNEHVHEQDQYLCWMRRLPLAQQNRANIEQHQNLMLSAQNLAIKALTAKHQLQKRMFLQDAATFPGLPTTSSSARERSLSPMPSEFAKSTGVNNLLAKQETVLNSLKSYKSCKIVIESVSAAFNNLQSRSDIDDPATILAFRDFYDALNPNMEYLTNFSFMFPKLIKDQTFLDTCLDDRMAKLMQNSVKTHMINLSDTGIKVMVASIINNFRSPHSDFRLIDEKILHMVRNTFNTVRAEFVAMHNYPYELGKDKEEVIAQRAKAESNTLLAATYGSRAQDLEKSIKELTKQFYKNEVDTKASLMEAAMIKHAKILENELPTPAAASSS